MHRILPTSMEASTATISACTATSLIARQLQWSSVPALWCFWGTCVTISSFAGNDELVAVEDSIDVSNVLWICYDCLSCQSNRVYCVDIIIIIFISASWEQSLFHVFRGGLKMWKSLTLKISPHWVNRPYIFILLAIFQQIFFQTIPCRFFWPFFPGPPHPHFFCPPQVLFFVGRLPLPIFI